MRIHHLKSVNDKVKGVLGRESIGTDEIFLFHDINPGTGFHMRGVKFPIVIAFLDEYSYILDQVPMEPETGKAKAPQKTVHAVEMHPEMASQLKVGQFWTGVYNRMLDNLVG